MRILKFPDGRDALAANGDVPRNPGISRTIDDGTISDDHIVVSTRRLILPRVGHCVVRRCRNFSESFTRDFLNGVWFIEGNRNHVYVQSQNEMFAVRGVHVTRKAFSGNH